jgi:hypothetical protein
MNDHPTRRSVVAGFAVLPAMSRDEGSPDAELIALGRQFDAITSAFDDAFRQVRPGNDLKQKALDRKMDGLLDLLGPVEAAIVATPARTIAGLYVKARAANWSREGLIDPLAEECTDERMAWSIVRDLITKWSS